MPFFKSLLVLGVMFFIGCSAAEDEATQATVKKVKAVDESIGHSIYFDPKLRVKCVQTKSGRNAKGYCEVVPKTEDDKLFRGKSVSLLEEAKNIVLDYNTVYFEFDFWAGAVSVHDLSDEGKAELELWF